MDVVAARLVLDEPERVVELADVVVVGRGSREQRVGPDRFRGSLGEIADHQRVVIGPGRLGQEPPQDGLRRVGELEQLEHGQDAEEVAEGGEGADGKDGSAGARRERRAPQLEHTGHVDLAFAQEHEGRDHGDVDDRHREARLDEHLQAIAAPHAR